MADSNRVDPEKLSKALGNRDEFSVCQFFEDGSYEYVRRFVSPEEAMAAFLFYTSNVASRMGLTKRVIITDGGDCVNAEWVYGKGVVYPTGKEVDGTN